MSKSEYPQDDLQILRLSFIYNNLNIEYRFFSLNYIK